MTKRQGRIWDLGAPYLSGGSEHGLDQGVVYNVPEAYKSEGRNLWRNRFSKENARMGEHLTEKLRGYMDDFGIDRAGDSIPYAQIAKDGAVLHMGGNGRWIEACATSFGCLAFHNLDSYRHTFAGFNIGSDALEYLDETLLCPKISVEGEKYNITYPLPNEENLPIERVSALTNHEIFNQWFNLGKLGEAKLTKPFGYEFENGRIYLEDNTVKAEVDNGWKVWGTTFVMGKLLDSFVYG